MKLKDARDLLNQLVEKYPDQEIRLHLPVDEEFDKSDEIRNLGYFTHLERTAHSDLEIVIKDKVEALSIER